MGAHQRVLNSTVHTQQSLTSSVDTACWPQLALSSMLSQVSVSALVRAVGTTTTRVAVHALHHPEITSCLVRCCLTALENFRAQQRVVLPSTGLGFAARSPTAVHIKIIDHSPQRQIGRRNLFQPVPHIHLLNQQMKSKRGWESTAGEGPVHHDTLGTHVWSALTSQCNPGRKHDRISEACWLSRTPGASKPRVEKARWASKVGNLGADRALEEFSWRPHKYWLVGCLQRVCLAAGTRRARQPAPLLRV